MMLGRLLVTAVALTTASSGVLVALNMPPASGGTIFGALMVAAGGALLVRLLIVAWRLSPRDVLLYRTTNANPTKGA